jgi:hypothetical protein
VGDKTRQARFSSSSTVRALPRCTLTAPRKSISAARCWAAQSARDSTLPSSMTRHPCRAARVRLRDRQRSTRRESVPRVLRPRKRIDGGRDRPRREEGGQHEPGAEPARRRACRVRSRASRSRRSRSIASHRRQAWTRSSDLQGAPHAGEGRTGPRRYRGLRSSTRAASAASIRVPES